MRDMFGIVLALIVIAVFLAILVAVILGVMVLYRKVMNIETPEKARKTSLGVDLFKDSLFPRVFSGLLLILVSLIPLSFVSHLVDERGGLYRQVSSRMTEEWSGAQQISGPVLTIPYEFTDYVSERIENKVTGEVRHEKKPLKAVRYLTVLPEKLDIDTSLDTQQLSRGIYRVPIYTSKSAMTGTFKWPDLTALEHQPENFLWSKSTITFQVTGAKGIQGGTVLKWDGKPVDLLPGTGLAGAGSSYQGVHARLDLDETMKTSAHSFDFQLVLRGSSSFSFAPTGKDSKIGLEANWGAPSFQGELLPMSREIGEQHFTAEWDISHLSRSYQQVQDLSSSEQMDFLNEVKAFSLGVDLFSPLNLYTLLDRTIKYGVLFISLTFFSIFIIEFASGARLHWLQHLVIGAALSMFYLCVLAFSEHIPFGYGYGIGMGLITVIIGGYTWAVIGKFVYGVATGGILLALYTVMYSILQMEDYALLIGTILLLVFLVLGMAVTRNMGQKIGGNAEKSQGAA